MRNVLVADEGVLWAAHQLREGGASCRPTCASRSACSRGRRTRRRSRVWAGLGADSINVPSDLSVSQIAELRAASDATLDLYVESPDDVGGFVRLYDTAELIRVAAPVYIKFGLRLAPGIYPVGRHLRSVAADTGRERVRRARLALDIVERGGGPPLEMSPVGQPELPVPERFS